jgi:serine protease Do
VKIASLLPLLLCILPACNRGAAKALPVASASAAELPPAPPLPLSQAPAGPITPGVNAPLTFADLAEKADPAVVFVETLQEQRGRTGRRRVTGKGLGSGFVYDPVGLILTNNHVIEGATEIRVIFGKNREMEAEIVGRDPLTDVAVLRVEAKDLPYLPLGDSDATRVGDWVVAIGNPFGLAHTVSAGIVSAKGRTAKDVRGLGASIGYYNFIQTDAAINQGNSGGPLLDLTGRVVGINTAIRANANNIGFAVPINMVRELLPHLVRDGHVRRSGLRIEVASLAAGDLDRLKLATVEGAIVTKVVRGGPGDRAGLQVDDVIVAFEGQEVPSPERLRWMASLAGVGKTVRVGVQRGKRKLELQVTLTELGELPGVAPPRESESESEDPDNPFGTPE